jgi:excisionase family DNA binding protein
MNIPANLLRDPRFLEVVRMLREKKRRQEPLTQAQQEALLARIVEVILPDSGQPHVQIEAGDGIISYPNRLRVQNLDEQEHVAGNASDDARQSSVSVLSNGLLPATNLPLPPEAQALRQVTIRQAAEILGVHERTIRRLVQAGELSAVGRGRLTRIPLRDIAAYQQRNRR